MSGVISRKLLSPKSGHRSAAEHNVRFTGHRPAVRARCDACECAEIADQVGLEAPDIEKGKAWLEVPPAFHQYTRLLEIHTGVNRKRQLNLYDPDGTRLE